MLKKLYERSQISFALVWIAAYVILASAGDIISKNIGVDKIVTLPVLIALSTVLIIFIRRNKLTEKYGLVKPQIRSIKMLFYLPLFALLTANLWYGVVLNDFSFETLLYILSMLCVGFLEEIIFRGFLFKAMAENGVKTAIVVSSITFGIGHFVNLANGSDIDLSANVLQVIYAMAVGFTFVMIFNRTKSLLPCIITHSVFNALSAFSNESAMSTETQIFSSLLIAIIAGGYALYITLFVKDEKEK